MDTRYSDLPEACKCPQCGYIIENPGRHCPSLGPCPVCGAPRLWRVRSNPGILVDENAIGAGAYTDIVEIVAPAEAESGSRVNITVRIKNLHSSTITIMADGALEYGGSYHPDIIFPADQVDTPGGWIAEFSGYFYMPDSPVTIHIYSFYYTVEGGWYFDDEMTKYVVLAPEISGRIVSKWVNKAPEGYRLPVPAAVAADGNTFEVGVRGRFTGDESTIVGMEVKVTDPDGKQRAAPAIDWTGMDPGEELEWEYNICRVDKPGPWKAVIKFVAKN